MYLNKYVLIQYDQKLLTTQAMINKILTFINGPTPPTLSIPKDEAIFVSSWFPVGIVKMMEIKAILQWVQLSNGDGCFLLARNC